MPSAYAYYRAFATALDDVTVSIPVTGVSLTTTAVCAQLVNATTGVSSGRWQGHWVNYTSGAGAPQSRRVAAYDPATGTLTVTPAWSSAPEIGAGMELTALFPLMSAAGADTDYLALLNAALGKIWLDGIEVTVTIPATPTDTISLAAYPGIKTPDQVQAVLEPHPVVGRSPVDATWRVREIATVAGVTTLRLKTPFRRALGSLTLRVRLQASFVIATGGTWSAADTNGLGALTDEARPPIQDVVDAALVEAYQALLARNPGTPNDPQLLKKLADQRVVARAVPGYRDAGPAPAPEPVAA